jgi:predicted small secreted protein
MLRGIFKNPVLIAGLTSTVILCACENTVRGAGRDIENAGESVQESVD